MGDVDHVRDPVLALSPFRDGQALKSSAGTILADCGADAARVGEQLASMLEMGAHELGARPSDVSKHCRLDERENQTYRLVVLFLAYTGVRFGEMAALRVSRLDLTRRRATIAESVTVVQGQGLVWGTPKSHERRQVPIPRFLVAEL
jgi:integrase